jgi:predicted nucleic acid-binding protein
MSRSIVVDASLAATWVLPEAHSEQALALAARWAALPVRLLAPCLILAEMANALYRRVARRELSLASAQAAFEVFLGFGVEVREEPGLQLRAMELADRLALPTVYDCQYLALMEYHRCELWTADHDFYRAAHRAFPRVRWIGEYRP